VTETLLLRALTMVVPGAVRVGRKKELPKTPRDEKLAGRPRASVAATLTTHGATA
jgi:hypothetical protein